MNFVEVMTPTAPSSPDGELQLPFARLVQGGIKGDKVVAGFRPEHLELGELAGDTASIRGTADVVEYLGNEELLHVTAGGRDIVAIVDSSHRVRPGDVVDLKLPLEKLHLFDATPAKRSRHAATRPRSPDLTSGSAAVVGRRPPGSFRHSG